MHKKTVLLILLSNVSGAVALETFKAVTIVPVANLAFQRLAPLFPNQKLTSCYHKMALEGTKASARSCPRAHQLLFNEQVEIIDRNGDEVLVRIPQCYFSTADAKNIKNNEYWAHKRDFLPLKKLEEQGLDTKLIPPAISFEAKTPDLVNNLVATLILPFEDAESGRTFSAGTRFILARPANKKEDTVKVWVFSPDSFTFTTLAINKNLCVTHYPQDSEIIRQAFVQMLRLWAQALENYFIPYVWGGCSFTTLYTDNMISGPTQITQKGITSFSLTNKKVLATGFDCSGVILRAAQILHIPYFFKNSLTALNNLKHISSYKDLALGDLIYIGGHVMVVANLKNNTLIEARSHYHYFGRLQEIKLSQEFKGIETYQQLIAAYTSGKTLERLDANGKVIAQIQDAQLLKLPI